MVTSAGHYFWHVVCCLGPGQGEKSRRKVEREKKIWLEEGDDMGKRGAREPTC